MPNFFFNLVSPTEYSRDEVGLEFRTVEEAWLEAFKAAVDMSCEFLRQQIDPRQYQFEITDTEGRFLMELAFSEIIRRPSARLPIHDQLTARMTRCRELRNELTIEFGKTRAVLAETRATLERAQSQG